jgi:predicted Fe-Mo cluster-binding NifX family protein
MKIAVSAVAPDLDAEVDPRFGRCQHFVIVDPESMEFETLENASAMAAGGAGISTAQMIADQGVEVVLTGNCGPNAYQTLSAAGVQVVTGASGRIRDAVEAYKTGKLQPNTQPSVGSHYGVGMGGGRGIGRGMGRGISQGMAFQGTSLGVSPEEEIEALKSQTQMMAQQLDEIQRRITELSKGR